LISQINCISIGDSGSKKKSKNLLFDLPGFINYEVKTKIIFGFFEKIFHEVEKLENLLFGLQGLCLGVQYFNS
jgi:hypothetical protein